MDSPVTISQVLAPDRIIAGLKAKTYEDAVSQLLDCVDAAGLISDRSAIDALVEAEVARAKKDEMQRQWRNRAKEVDGVVDAETIAEVVSGMTGVPLTRLEKDEIERLLRLEVELHKRVISQDEAIGAVASAVLSSSHSGTMPGELMAKP